MRSFAISAVLGALMIAAAGCTSTLEGHSTVAAARSGQSGAASSEGPPLAGSGSAAPGGSSANSNAGAPGPDGAAHPCALLPKAQAEALAGTSLLAGIESGQGADKTLCQYAGPTTGPLAQVQVIVGDGAKKVLDIDRGILKHPFTTLSGVGDEAYQEENDVFVRKADTWVSISLARLNDPTQNVKPLQTAASEVASRLG